jgi:hypothetical protein
MMPMFVLMNDVLVVRYSMTMAPSIAPAMLLRPGTNTISSSVIWADSLSTSGVTRPWALASTAPPTAASTDPSTNTSSRRCLRLTPMDSPSRSSSAIAISWRPMPERMTRSTSPAARPSSSTEKIPERTSVDS